MARARSRSQFPTAYGTAGNQSGIIPVHKAIDKYFELSLYLLVLTGFATLAGTGGLDLPSVFWWAPRWRYADICWPSGGIRNL